MGYRDTAIDVKAKGEGGAATCGISYSVRPDVFIKATLAAQLELHEDQALASL